MRKEYVITETALKRMEACETERLRFKELFGDKPVAFTKANAKKAARAGLPLYFLLRMLFKSYYVSHQALAFHAKAADRILCQCQKKAHLAYRRYEACDSEASFRRFEAKLRALIRDRNSKMACLFIETWEKDLSDERICWNRDRLFLRQERR